MPDPSSSTPGDDSRQAARGSSRSEKTGERVRTLHREYASAVQEIIARAQQRGSQVQFDFVRALRDVQLAAQKAQEAAYATYIADVQAACGQGPGRLPVGEIEQRYVKALESAQSQARQALEDAQRTASSATQQASEEASRAWDEARAAYLRGIRDQFAELDPQGAEPDVIAMIGRSLLAAAQYARPSRPT
jgi:hypothetical protein